MTFLANHSVPSPAEPRQDIEKVWNRDEVNATIDRAVVTRTTLTVGDVQYHATHESTVARTKASIRREFGLRP